MFLATLNLPMADCPEFLFWIEKIFKGFAGKEMDEAAKAVRLDPRLLRPGPRRPQGQSRQDTETDFLSRMLVSSLDGVPISDEDIITICLTLMAAALDTTRSALGYIFYHLARDPELRHRLTADPDLWPTAVESSCACTRSSSWTAAWSTTTSTFTACT